MSFKQIISGVAKGALNESLGKQSLSGADSKPDIKVVLNRLKQDGRDAFDRIVKVCSDEVNGLLTRFENLIDEYDPPENNEPDIPSQEIKIAKKSRRQKQQ